MFTFYFNFNPNRGTDEIDTYLNLFAQKALEFERQNILEISSKL